MKGVIAKFTLRSWPGINYGHWTAEDCRRFATWWKWQLAESEADRPRREAYHAQCEQRAAVGRRKDFSDVASASTTFRSGHALSD